MFIKKSLFGLIFVLFILTIFSNCFSSFEGYDSGTISINLGSSGNPRSLIYPPEQHGILNDLIYNITLSGNGNNITFTAKGGESIRRSVPVGHYNVKIDVSYKDNPYASGSNSVDVKSGQNNSVTVNMKFDPRADFFGTWHNVSTTETALINVNKLVYTRDNSGEGHTIENLTWIPKQVNDISYPNFENGYSIKGTLTSFNGDPPHDENGDPANIGDTIIDYWYINTTNKNLIAWGDWGTNGEYIYLIFTKQ